MPSAPKLKYTHAFSRSIPASDGPIRHLAFSSNGKWLAGAVGDHLKIWNVETGAEAVDFKGSLLTISVSWVKDHDIVWAVYPDGWLTTCDMADFPDQSLHLYGTGQLQHTCFHPSGLWLATQDENVTIIWKREDRNLKSKSRWILYQHRTAPVGDVRKEVKVITMAWLNGRHPKQLLVVYRHHGIITWNIHDSESSLPASIRHLAKPEILAADLSPGADKIVVLQPGRAFTVYNTTSYVTEATLGWPVLEHAPVAFAHGGRAILCALPFNAKLFNLRGEAYATFDLYSPETKIEERSPIVTLATNYDDGSDTFNIAIATSTFVRVWRTEKAPELEDQDIRQGQRPVRWYLIKFLVAAVALVLPVIVAYISEYSRASTLWSLVFS